MHAHGIRVITVAALVVGVFGSASAALGTRADAADVVGVDDVSIAWAQPPTWTLENLDTALSHGWWYRIDAKAWITPDLDFSLSGTPVSVMATNPATGATVFALYNLLGGPNSDCPLYADGAWEYTTGLSADAPGILPGSYTVSEVCLTQADSTTNCRAPRTSEAVTFTIPAFGDGLTRAYITAVYADLFHRAPDPAGLATWTGQLMSGTPYGQVANAITGSAEYRSRLITATYQRYLGRDPEAAGLAFWLGQMNSGRHIEQMQSGFIASDEFYARGGGTDRGWVTLLYQTVLDRSPASSEVDWWVSTMQGGMNRGTVSLGFLYSSEHLTTVVDGYYVDLLGRHIDPSGKATWVGLIQSGSRDEQIIAAIVSSTEYRTNVGR